MTLKNLKLILLFTLAAGIAVNFSACNKKGVKKTDASLAGIEDTATLPLVESTDTFDAEGNIRGTEFAEHTALKLIYFDFDRYLLSDSARKTLQANADIVKNHKEWELLVEGHCDERGTIEYNLALGQKRAKEVRDYYVRLGIPENSIGTISYGEEKPVCSAQTDECWAKNRRGETKFRIRQ
ncbi:MAG: peptidoglycan-associated lipoprotein Pal [Elusimicrobia bacterium]|nr:peptidoglycan-associated lipoprotein Pal [Elusimicrobiota bacterium]